MQDLIAKVTRMLEAGPPLRLAVLFGSYASGRAHPKSDIDIAILPADSTLSLGHELALAAELSRSLGREVDLVRIDRASTLVRWEIARHGVLVLAEPAWEWVRFRANTASEHADIEEALGRAAELLRQRLAGPAR